MSTGGPGWIRVGWRMRRKLLTTRLAPYRHALKHPGTLVGRGAMELAIFSARSVDLRLKELAGLRAASLVGCVW